MDTSFTAEVFEWRGPAPFYWVLLPVATREGRTACGPGPAVQVIEEDR